MGHDDEHAENRWYLVSYDIRDPARWREAYKTLKGTGGGMLGQIRDPWCRKALCTHRSRPGGRSYAGVCSSVVPEGVEVATGRSLLREGLFIRGAGRR